ncbi:MAG: glycoside hydrolase family 25 protein [Parasporobacterium sp.]|nr:glycoside hydrolase family 25 protein [Parasporobacterium sp.]
MIRAGGLIWLAFTIFILTSLFCVSVVSAERYYGEADGANAAGEADITNHLREDCWVKDGSYLYYTEEGFTSRIGVDVSKWNGDIDWAALKEQGVEFAIVRLGFRGYETGELVLDERFHEYMAGAAEAGLEVGVYFFSAAIDEEEAVQEAGFVIDNLADYEIDLPVYFDTEEAGPGQARTEPVAAGMFTLNAEAFCKTVESAGYRAGVYASNRWIQRNLELAWLSDYEIWYAQYNDTPGREYGFDMWQYTEHGDLYGCGTYLDMNIRVERER